MGVYAELDVHCTCVASLPSSRCTRAAERASLAWAHSATGAPPQTRRAPATTRHPSAIASSADHVLIRPVAADLRLWRALAGVWPRAIPACRACLVMLRCRAQQESIFRSSTEASLPFSPISALSTSLDLSAVLYPCTGYFVCTCCVSNSEVVCVFIVWYK